MTQRRLVVSADDFGAAAAVNEAVVRAHRDGILTNASLMVTGDAAAEAVRMARALPALGTGLHLVLAQGRPASAPERITRLVRRDGTFRNAPVATGLLYAWIYLSRVGHAQLRAEIDAQLAAFARTGLRLSHVDGHLNMHLHPMVLRILLELAPRHGVRAVRLTREPLLRAVWHDGKHVLRRSLEGTVFAALARYAAPRLAAAGIATPVRVYGMHQTGEVDEAYVRRLLGDLPPGTSELYCHPSLGRAAQLERHQPGYRNDVELAALVSPAVRRAAEDAGVALVSYHALADAPSHPLGTS
jgi:hopanoid biosynthesis associated protein HpnK